MFADGHGYSLLQAAFDDTRRVVGDDVFICGRLQKGYSLKDDIDNSIERERIDMTSAASEPVLTPEQDAALAHIYLHDFGCTSELTSDASPFPSRHAGDDPKVTIAPHSPRERRTPGGYHDLQKIASACTLGATAAATDNGQRCRKDELITMKKNELNPFIRENCVMALIEIPRGSKNKYEWDEEMGGVALSRVLYQSVAYPAEYGFIPGTLAEDGDALDVVVLIDQPTFPGCFMRVRPIGILKLRQEGERDDKVLCVAQSDPLYADTHDISDIPTHRLLEIRHFFATYTELEGREVEVGDWEGAEAARCEIRECLLPEFRDEADKL